MGGPTAGVLFATAIAPLWQNTLDEIVGLVGSRWKNTSIWVETTRPIGGSYEGIGRHFMIGEAMEYEHPWEDETAWPNKAGETFAVFCNRVFGLIPDKEIMLDAGPNRPEDHRILGELAITIAEQLNGVIDMGGLITPNTVSYEEWLGAPWPAVQSRVETFTGSMPGKAVAVPYQRVNGLEWASHMVDATFLRAWMRHPKFSMIK